MKFVAIYRDTPYPTPSAFVASFRCDDALQTYGTPVITFFGAILGTETEPEVENFAFHLPAGWCIAFEDLDDPEDDE